MECSIRLARPQDAEPISQIIIAALQKTNADDYPATVIARVEQSFMPAAVAELLERRLVFVALDDDTVVGTASLDGESVRTVFIDPRYQGLGIGRALMTEVERAAMEKGIAILGVPSSVTAEPFYAKLGFSPVRDSYHGEERTIVMERVLRPLQSPMQITDGPLPRTQ